MCSEDSFLKDMEVSLVEPSSKNRPNRNSENENSYDNNLMNTCFRSDSLTSDQPPLINATKPHSSNGETANIKCDEWKDDKNSQNKTNGDVKKLEQYLTHDGPQTESSDIESVPVSPSGSSVLSEEKFHTVKTGDSGQKQGSLVTIFSLWNTMMGTSILVMPWTLQQAGFSFGILLILIVAGLACYCAYLILKSTEDLKILQNLQSNIQLDFTDVCFYHLGQFGKLTSLVFSMFSLVGALIVYYVLLCNFLYFTGEYIYELTQPDNHNTYQTIVIWNNTYDGVICPNPPTVPIEFQSTVQIYSPITTLVHSDDSSNKRSIYSYLWSKTRTVPAWLMIILLAIISIRSPAFFSKFSAFGTLSVLYLFSLICYKAAKWGFHMNFTSTHPYLYVPQFKSTFPTLTGICSLAFYLHNALHAITSTHKRPEHNTRVVTIAFICVTVTYLGVALIFYSSFPLAKSCIEDNLLNNLATDVPVFIGRLGLFLQMLTVYPMLTYVLRVQIMQAVFKNPYPSFFHVSALHLMIVALGVLFAMFMPKIGTIIRFSGSLCGLIYIFTLPPLITLLNANASRKQRGTQNSGSIPELQNVSEYESKLKESQREPASNDQPIGNYRVLKWVKLTNTCDKVKWVLFIIFHICIMLIGLANFLAQFVVVFVKN